MLTMAFRYSGASLFHFWLKDDPKGTTLDELPYVRRRRISLNDHAFTARPHGNTFRKRRKNYLEPYFVLPSAFECNQSLECLLKNWLPNVLDVWGYPIRFPGYCHPAIFKVHFEMGGARYDGAINHANCQNSRGRLFITQIECASLSN
jgi:hypothetical protein